MAACVLVFSVRATYAQLPSIRVNGPFVPQPPEPSVFEGSLGGPISTLNFTVELSAVPTQDVSVLFSTFTLNSPGGNAVSGANCATANTLNGTDFIGIANQPVLIPANTNPPSVTVPVTVIACVLSTAHVWCANVDLANNRPATIPTESASNLPLISHLRLQLSGIIAVTGRQSTVGNRK